MKNILLTQLQLLICSVIPSATRNSLFIKKGFYAVFILPLLLVYTNTSAQVTTVTNLTANDYVETIIGQGIEYSGAVINGNFTSIATYTGGAGGGMQPTMDTGIVMSSGFLTNPTLLHGPNTGNISGSTGMPGFPQLNALSGVSTFDGISLEFDFIPLTPELKINFQFGSEEYNEYVNSSFNDVFGFFIYGPGFPVTGQNLALAPGGARVDRKSTRLNSSHVRISYAVFCLKK